MSELPHSFSQQVTQIVASEQQIADELRQWQVAQEQLEAGNRSYSR